MRTTTSRRSSSFRRRCAGRQTRSASLVRTSSGPVLIVFADTIFSTDLTHLKDTDADGVIYVKEVENPHSFGIVEMRDQYLRRIVEKPANPPTNLAVAGLYYFRDSDAALWRD